MLTEVEKKNAESKYKQMLKGSQKMLKGIKTKAEGK